MTGPAPLVVTIPGTPHPRLAPNAKPLSPYRRSDVVRQDRAKAALATRSAINGNPARAAAARALRDAGRLRYLVEIFWGKGTAPKDPDNARAHLKAFIDGIAHELGVDDRHWEPGDLRQGREPEGGGLTIFTLWPRPRIDPAAGPADPDPGRIAYEHRPYGFGTLAWDDLLESTRDGWRDTAAAVAAGVAGRYEARIAALLAAGSRLAALAFYAIPGDAATVTRGEVNAAVGDWDALAADRTPEEPGGVD
jgi:hypothetical protein